ncbi:MAG TPA: hypothetical protein VJ748_10205 [Vitreimonas sp.]|jgi:hypothetical protein|nr:hypothetical protein [Vitreimonas sp.]
MRTRAPLRIAAVGLVLVCVAVIDGEFTFVAAGGGPARAARRVKKYDSLTGLWTGAYRYSRSAAAVPFNARLEESRESFTGEIDEPNTFADPSAARLSASVHGSRTAFDVRFVKTYDGSAGQSHTVGYEGVVNPDFTRIDGQWSLPGSSGTFFMERADVGAEAAASRAAGATA